MLESLHFVAAVMRQTECVCFNIIFSEKRKDFLTQKEILVTAQHFLSQGYATDSSHINPIIFNLRLIQHLEVSNFFLTFPDYMY